ncbi:hypothetical protein GG681_11035 [Epibacterium sp. SM1969]|uniref:Lipoprotein n=1 Tax=Tritonibacter aquimaris TaxID=2663379 RepID=A0A844AM36_9RHOB|nr:hypothetical protein [Tritonibacter aquimaris]MQY43175.1 hypothetical protein [Tritonibacter aquimaris]
MTIRFSKLHRITMMLFATLTACGETEPKTARAHFSQAKKRPRKPKDRRENHAGLRNKTISLGYQ